MFFIFVFIFVKIYSIQTAVAAVDNDIPVSSVLSSQDTNSPPRKSRRQAIDSKVTDPDDSDHEHLSRETDKTLSPFRKGATFVQTSDKENHKGEIIPPDYLITISSPPRQETLKNLHLRKFPQRKKGWASCPRSPVVDVTDDEDEDEDDTDSEDDDLLVRSSAAYSAASLKDDTDCEDDLALELTPAKGTAAPDSVGKLSPEQRESLGRDFQLSPEAIDRVEALNCALRIARDVEIIEEFLSAYPDPEDQAFIKRILNRYRSPVRKPSLVGVLLTPALRDFLSRIEIKRAVKVGLAESLPKDASKLPQPEETEEEKAERKRKQSELFLRIESERGKSLGDIAEEIKAEAALWENYFRCILHRKNEAISDTGEKITKDEIIDIFEEYVKKSYQMFKMEGYEVYVPLLSLDFERTDRDGLPNYDILKTYKQCPIGPDNEIMNYHHLTHHDAKTHGGRSIVVLITKTLHTKFSGALHFTKSTYKNLPSILDRALFTRARNNFGPKIIKTFDDIKKLQRIVRKRYSKD